MPTPMLINPVSLPARNSDQSYPVYAITRVEGAHYAAVTRPVKLPHPSKSDLRPSYILGVPTTALPEPDFSDIPLWLTHIRSRRDGLTAIASQIRPIIHAKDGDVDEFWDMVKKLDRFGVTEAMFMHTLILDLIVQPFFMNRQSRGQFDRAAPALLGVSLSMAQAERAYSYWIKTVHKNFRFDRGDPSYDMPRHPERKHVSQRIGLSEALNKSLDENSHEDMLAWVYAFMSGPLEGGAAVCNEDAQARRIITLTEYCKSLGFTSFRETLKAGHGRGLYAAMAWYTGDEPKPKKPRDDGWIEGEAI